VTDQASNADKGKPDQGVPKGALPADIGEVTTNESIDKKDESESTKQIAEPVFAPLVEKMLKLPGKWWEELKDPGVSNRTIAVATVIIAIATGFTWYEVHSSSAQTDKLVTAATNIHLLLILPI
jgi:hypothetical protein